MPLDVATKKTIEATESAKKAEKQDTKAKQVVAPGASFADGAAALKPKESPAKKGPEDPAKKESQESKTAKKEAVKKEPPKPEQVAKKVNDKKDDKLSPNAVHEATMASYNAAKFNAKELKGWIGECSEMLKKADKAQTAALQACIARFTQAEEALKKSKGVDEKELKKFLSDAQAKNLDPINVQELVDQGEAMLPRASKTQLSAIKKALDNLYSQGGVG